MEARLTDRPSAVVFLRDRFLEPGEAASVSLFDRGYLLGDSVFETLRSYGGVPFRLGEHLRRLEHSAQVLGLTLPQPPRALAELVRSAIARRNLPDTYIRVTVSRGEGPGGISPAGCDRPVLSIVVRALEPYPPEAYARGIRSAVVATRRIPAACIDPAVKCGNYLPSILARRELDGAGMIEGVQLAVDGQVASGTVSNLFLVKAGRLRTPHLASGCLPGITRAAVLEVAAGAGIVASEEKVDAPDLHRADEIFFTNSLMECLPVAQLGEHHLGEAPGPSTRALHAALRALVTREVGGAT